MSFPVLRLLFVLALTCLHAPIAQAQSLGVVQSDVLVLDPERLFEETRLGQSMMSDFQEEREALIARNRKLEAALEAEEKELTEKRAETTPEEFREMADAFDEKVQRIRTESDRRARDLERRRELAPARFMRQVEPVLIDILRDGSGVVILDSRSVLLRADVVDITETAIRRIDAEIGAKAPARNGGGDGSGREQD